MEDKNKLTKFITIGLTADEQCGVNVSPDLDAGTAFQLLGTLMLHLLNAYYQVASTQLNINHSSGNTPAAQKLSQKELASALTGIKESMYDAMNNITSNVLTRFYPEAPRLNLEEEAIIELTNKKIEERYDQLSDKEKEAYRASYNALTKQLQLDLENEQNQTDAAAKVLPDTDEDVTTN